MCYFIQSWVIEGGGSFLSRKLDREIAFQSRSQFFLSSYHVLRFVLIRNFLLPLECFFFLYTLIETRTFKYIFWSKFTDNKKKPKRFSPLQIDLKHVMVQVWKMNFCKKKIKKNGTSHFLQILIESWYSKNNYSQSRIRTYHFYFQTGNYPSNKKKKRAICTYEKIDS